MYFLAGGWDRFLAINFTGLVERTLGFFQAFVRKGLRRVNAETDHSICRDGEFLQMNEP